MQQISELRPSPLTAEERAFLDRWGVAEADVLDGRKTPKKWWKNYRDNNLGVEVKLIFGQPCKKGGHRLRTVHGHCVMCNDNAMLRVKRRRDKYCLYLAYSSSAGLVKIGTSQDIDRRLVDINRYGYGGFTDWIMIWSSKPFSGASRFESWVQGELAEYRENVKYSKHGNDKISNEVFRCSPDVAIEAIKMHIPRINEL